MSKLFMCLALFYLLFICLFRLPKHIHNFSHLKELIYPNSESFKKLSNSIYQGFMTVLITLGSALAAAYLLVVFDIPSYVLTTMQIISAFSILWAIVGKLGYPIQTIGGTTLPEAIDNFWFIFLNVIGIFCLFFTQFYSLFKI